MTQDQINFAFEGRWRVKGNFGQINAARACMSTEEFYDYIKDMCRDFFETGVLVAHGPVDTVACELPHVEVLPQSILEQEFSVWWKLYDKMVGRKDCLKKWAKLTVKEKKACLDATPAYVASTPDKKFRKNPLSYLNQKAWNDEIIPPYGNKPNDNQQRLDKLASILTD